MKIEKKLVVFRLVALQVLVLLLAACGLVRELAPAHLPSVPTVSGTPGVIPASGSQLGTPTGLAIPPPNPQAAGEQAPAGQPSNAGARITIRDQDVSRGTVTIAQVVSAAPGWVVIQSQDPNGLPGPVIGYAAVKAGVNQNVRVSIDSSKATHLLIAMLLTDAGKQGLLEYPGADVPAVANGQVVLSVFSVLPPTANATADAAALVSTTPGAAFGVITPAAGTSVPVTGTSPADGQLQALNATATALSANASASSGSAASSAAPTEAGSAVPTTGLNPLVRISDQIIRNGMVRVDEVISAGPGWIVIYTVKGGQPNVEIGRLLVRSGDNRDVLVPVNASLATPILTGILHVDAGKPGIFEYPGPDAPVVVGLQIVSAQFRNIAPRPARTPTATIPPSR